MSTNIISTDRNLKIIALICRLFVLWLEREKRLLIFGQTLFVSGLKTILRFDSAELYLALNREVPDEVVSKLQAEPDKLREEGFVDDIVNNYL